MEMWLVQFISRMCMVKTNQILFTIEMSVHYLTIEYCGLGEHREGICSKDHIQSLVFHKPAADRLYVVLQCSP